MSYFLANIKYDTVLFGQHDDQEENKAICAENLTNALARLSLYIKPSFDMTFALILGVRILHAHLCIFLISPF